MYDFPCLRHYTLSSDDPLVRDMPKADEQKMTASYTLPSERIVNTNDSSTKQGKIFSIALCVGNEFSFIHYILLYLQIAQMNSPD